MASGVKLTGDWKKLTATLDKATVTAKMQKEVGIATELNARLAARAMRQAIKGNVPPPLANLTIGIKRSKKALVDHGELFRGLVGVRVTWRKGEAGVVRTSPEMVNLAKTLQEGVTIKVTAKMRGLFQRLAAASKAKNGSKLTGRAAELWARNPKFKWLPLKPGTTAIVIKGRPFMQMALDNPALREQMRQNWANAFAKVLNP